jgi:Protein of unknown function (DUF1674)
MVAHDAHVVAMNRAIKRPRHLDAPDYLSPSPPVPEPAPLNEPVLPAGEEQKLDPTRYGDWEKKGIAIDF